MDTNITFRLDSDTKEQMTNICQELGMTVSTAFNLFANAFVRTRGMPFPVTIDASTKKDSISREQMLTDVRQVLKEFRADYAEMAR